MSPPEAVAQSEVRPMHFHFHHASEAVMVGGTSTPFTMDTWKVFNNPPRLFKEVGQPKITVKFYLAPSLAGPVTFDGEWQAIVFLNSTALHPATWNIRFLELSPTGETIWDSGDLTPEVSGGPAGSPRSVTVQILSYTLTVDQVHTFRQGSTVQVQITVNTGSTVAASFWYDSPSYPSQMIFPSRDYASIQAIRMFDGEGNEASEFETTWPESRRKVVIRAEITDPFGGYDVYQAKMNITDPGGRILVSEQVLNKVSGDRYSFVSIYEWPDKKSEWIYPPTAEVGNYTVTVGVIDNNGRFLFEERYVKVRSATFTIGVLVKLTVIVKDSKDIPLSSSIIKVQSNGGLLGEGLTDTSGSFSLLVPEGTLRVLVFWQGSPVAEAEEAISEASTIIIRARVYSPIFLLTDHALEPLERARVHITFTNKSLTVMPEPTGFDGLLGVQRIAGGTLHITVIWKDIEVFSKPVEVSSDGPIKLRTNVFRMTAEVVDSNHRALDQALVTAISSTGSILVSNVTDGSGHLLMRLPTEVYDLKVYWKGVEVNRTSIIAMSDKPVTFVTRVYMLGVNVNDTEGNPLKGAHIALLRSGDIFGYGVSDSEGRTSYLLPFGVYTLNMWYNSTYWLTGISNQTEIIFDLDENKVIDVVLSNIPPPLWATIGFWLIVAPVVAVAILLILIRVRHGRKAKTTMPS